MGLTTYHPTSLQMTFRLTACAHIIGRTYSSTWLNGTSRNVKTCPYCFWALCERRLRRPKSVARAVTLEQRGTAQSLEYGLALLEDVAHMRDAMICEGMEDERSVWLDSVGLLLTPGCCANNVGFGFGRDGVGAWRLQ